MINAVPNPTSSNTAPQGAPSGAPAPQAQQPASQPPSNNPPKKRSGKKKLFGVDRRAVFTVLGLTSFLVLAMAGVYIALIQRVDEGPVAPTAPESRPEAAQVIEESCSLVFEVPSDVEGRARVNCTFYNGYACAPRIPDFPLKIEVYDAPYEQAGRNKLAEDRARVTRDQGVTDRCGDPDHGMRVRVPESIVAAGGTHTAYVYAVDPDTRERILLDGNPVSFDMSTCAEPEETPTSSISCSKASYEDELSNSPGTYQLLTRQTNFQPGDVVVFQLNRPRGTTQASSQTPLVFTDVVPTNMTFMDSDCGANAYDSATNTLTCTSSGTLTSTATGPIFRARVNANVADGTTITNTAEVTDNTNSASCEATITITEEEVETTTLSCADSCDPNSTTDVCPDDHTCSANTGTCVYNPCLEDDVSCDTDQCVIENDEPGPTPVGCQDSCQANSDCADPDHLCWNGECRLATNPNSTTCTEPPAEVIETVTRVLQQTQTTTQVVQQPAEPVIPEVLPETGVLDEGLRVLGAGFAAVTLGGLLLLLL